MAIGWGDNFQARSLAIERFGIFHRLALPAGVAKRDDVHDFDVELSGADDFARISINNYWVMSTENPTNLISDRLGQDQASVNLFVGNYGVQRNHGMGRLGKAFHLRPGRNYIVYELENGKSDYCSGGFRLSINGQDLLGLPGAYPMNVDEVRALLGSDDRSFADVLCSRRIVEIDLGVEAEPIRRFWRLVGF